jgi:hypothetical protein
MFAAVSALVGVVVLPHPDAKNTTNARRAIDNFFIIILGFINYARGLV